MLVRGSRLGAVKYPAVVFGIEQATGFAEPGPSRAVAHPVKTLGSQALAALGATAVQYVAAAFGRHA